MRILALHFHLTSVAGIASELRALRHEAIKKGHTWETWESQPFKSFAVKEFKQPMLVRGGDTYIKVWGKVSNHSRHSEEVANWVAMNFDLVYLPSLCPRPNSMYGDDPMFIDLLNGIKGFGVPIVGRITDGYFSTYHEWGMATLDLCDKATCHESYLVTVPEEYVRSGRVKSCEPPFLPQTSLEKRSEAPSIAWISQWKAIKGVNYFVPALKHLTADTIDLYSNGIRYYQLRGEEKWLEGVGTDYFDPDFYEERGLQLKGKAVFHGYVDHTIIPDILSKAWVMPDFQGLGNPRYEAYKKGSINLTMIEALYYGTVLAVADNCPLPEELGYITATNIGGSTYMSVVKCLNDWDTIEYLLKNEGRTKLAKEFVLDNYVNKLQDMVLV